MFLARWNRLSNLNRRTIHLGSSPFGASIVTYLGVNIFGDGDWLIWKAWPEFAGAFLYGVLGYGSIAFLVWAVIKGLDYAIRSVYRAGRDEGFAEHQGQAIRDGRKEGMKMVMGELWRLAEATETKTLLRQVANNNNLNVAAIGGGTTVTARVRLLSPWDTLGKRFADTTAEFRKRFLAEGKDVDKELDFVLRGAVGVGVAELASELERLQELDERRSSSQT